jgi:hypothetical protein
MFADTGQPSPQPRHPWRAARGSVQSPKARQFTPDDRDSVLLPAINSVFVFKE